MGGPSFEVLEIGRALTRSGAGRRALDLGAGSGRNALFLASEGMSTTAVERDQALIAEALRAQAASGISFSIEESHVETFGFTGPFDLCLVLGILHFLPFETALDVVQSLKAETAPEGIHVIALSHRRPGEHFANSLAAQGHLNSVRPNDVLSCYSDWDLLAHETYVKRDTHADGVVETHPIDKLVFARSGTSAADRIQVRALPLGSRPDQPGIDAALESLDFGTASIDHVRGQLGAEDVWATATAARPQLGFLTPSPQPYEIAVGFWGRTKGYFENGMLVGTARYLTDSFHRFLPAHLSE